MRLINLIPLQEIDFPNQRAFDQYNKVHKLRPDTKVTVAGRVTTAGRASLDSKDTKGTSVFPTAKKKPTPQDNDVFDGGVDVLDTVTNLLPPGTGFTNKKTGDKITVQRYDDDNMYVSYDKVPGKELKWPMKQFLKMASNKELQFTPKDKSTPNQQQSYNPAQAFNDKVSKMTDNNDHSAAAVELAIYMNDKETLSKLQQIKKLRDNRGYLRPSEAKERGEIVNNLLQRAQKELPKKDYDLISSAF
jgi:hypothetical protein